MVFIKVRQIYRIEYSHEKFSDRIPFSIGIPVTKNQFRNYLYIIRITCGFILDYSQKEDYNIVVYFVHEEEFNEKTYSGITYPNINVNANWMRRRK